MRRTQYNFCEYYQLVKEPRTDRLTNIQATEDLSVEISSPTSKNRKRFAGIWDDQDFSNMPDTRVDKKARTEPILDGEGAKENIPASESQGHNEFVYT